MTVKRIIIFVLIIVLCLSFTACGNEYERQADKTNTLYVGYVSSSFPTSFMPWLSRDGIAPTIASTLFSTLFSYDDDTGLFEPSLAKSWCYLSPTGEELLTEEGSVDYDRLDEYYSASSKAYLPVKVTLHEDMTWSDGKPFTVEDVYYTFDIGTNSYLSNHTGAKVWTSDLKHTYDDKTGEMTSMPGIFTYYHNYDLAQDYGYTITEEEKDTVIYFHVNKVIGAVTTLFTTILILPQHIWQPIVTHENPLNVSPVSGEPSAATKTQYENPVCNGAYVLDKPNTNSQIITLVRRPNYHLKAGDGSELYKPDKIIFMLYQEINVAIYALLKGHIDILDSSISSNYMSLFEKHENIYVSNAEGLFTQSLVLNVNPESSQKNPMRNLLADVEFRQAIALAINQDELIKNVLNGSGSKIGAGLISSTSSLYNEESNILSGDYEARKAQANAILDAKFPQKDKEGYRLMDGKRISFSVFGAATEQEIIGFLQVQLQKVGIELKYQAKGSSVEDTYLFNSRFDMTLQGVSFTLSSVDVMYESHFVKTGRTSNYGRMNNPELTAKITQMRRMLNLNDKFELIDEVQLMIAQQYYKIPLYTSNVLSVARTDRFIGYVTVKGSNIFNSETLQNLQFVGQ